MRSELVICEKKYTDLDLDFAKLAQFEDFGIDPFNIGSKPIKEVTAYIACVADVSLAEASKLIKEHVKAGGEFNDFMACYAEAVSESDFFKELLRDAMATKQEKKKK